MDICTHWQADMTVFVSSAGIPRPPCPRVPFANA
jgi:hypothetical protein